MDVEEEIAYGAGTSDVVTVTGTTMGNTVTMGISDVPGSELYPCCFFGEPANINAGIETIDKIAWTPAARESAYLTFCT